MNRSEFMEKHDSEALRITVSEMRALFHNRLLWAIAEANLRRAPEYRCMVEGKPVIIRREAVSQ